MNGCLKLGVTIILRFVIAVGAGLAAVFELVVVSLDLAVLHVEVG